MMWVAIPVDLSLNQSRITTHFAGRLQQIVGVTMTIRVPVTNCSCRDSHLQTTWDEWKVLSQKGCEIIPERNQRHIAPPCEMQPMGEPTFANTD